MASPNGSSNGNGMSPASSSNIPRMSAVLANKLTQDPALQAVGMPPNYGKFVLPHIMTLQGLVNTISRTYVVSDEALNDSFSNARFMEYDVGIRECLDARIRSSILLDWHIEPEDDTDPLQVEVCGKLTKIVKAIEEWQQILEQWAWAVWFGRSGVQFRMGWQQVGGQCYTMPVHWLPIHGDKLVFRLMDGDYNHNQHQVGIRVGQSYKRGDYIDTRGKSYATNPYSTGYNNDLKGAAWQIEPTDRGLAYFLSPNEQKLVYIHKHQIQDAAYERPQDAGRIHGVGIRSVVYWEWFMEKNTLQWLMEFIERSAFGLELWYYPLGNEKARQDGEKAIKERVGPFKHTLMVPVPPDDGPGKQYGVDHIETGAQGADILLNIIEKYFGHRRKRYILGQILTTEAEATGLGGNLASIHLLSFRDIVKADSKSRDNCATKFVNWLKQLNFPGNAHWKARYVTETDPVDADERLNALKSAQDLGADITKKSIYKAAGITPPGPDDEIATPGGAMAGMMPGQVPPSLGGLPIEGQPNMNGNVPPNVETMPEPVKQYADKELRTRIESAAKQTDANPSKEQKEAGNYKKGFVSIHGLPIAIETPKGAYREGKGWRQKMTAHYGYFKGQDDGKDGDAIDCFIGPDPESDVVYVVDQTKTDGSFDEHKVLLGWYCLDEAKQGYLSNYSKGWKIGKITPLTIDQFKEWLDQGSQRKPLHTQTAFYSETTRYSEPPAKYADGEGHVINPQVFYHGNHQDLGNVFHDDTYLAHNQGIAKEYGKHVRSVQHSATHIFKPDNVKEVEEESGVKKDPNSSFTFEELDRPKVRTALKSKGWHGVHFEDIAPNSPGDRTHKATLIFDKKYLHLASEHHEHTAQYSEPKDAAHAARRQIQMHKDMIESGNLTDAEKSYHATQIKALTPQSKSVDLREHIRKLEPAHADKGALVSAHVLHQSSGLSKPEFDKRFIEQHKAGEIQGHRHDYVSSLTDAERGKLVHHPEGNGLGDGKGAHYLAASLGREDRVKYGQEFETLHPRGQPENSGEFVKRDSKSFSMEGSMLPATRVGTGKEARVVFAHNGETVAHIGAGMIPPAWTDVHVATDPKSDVLVKARDEAGRIKTVYSESHDMRTAAEKFSRINEFMRKREAIAGQIANDRKSADPKTREAADCLFLIQEQGTRPGSDKDTKSKVKAYGATTLRAEHVVINGDKTRLDFIGKEGVHHNHEIHNSELAKMLRERAATASSRGGKLFDTNDTNLRKYTEKLDGGKFTPKDFRTVKATGMAISEIKAIGACCQDKKEYKSAVLRVATKVSGVLGNRPKQAIESYINPTVWSQWRCPNCA